MVQAFSFYCVSKCPPTKRIKTSPDLPSVATSESHSTLITIAPHAGNLARVMTPVSRLNLIMITHRKRYVKKQKRDTNKDDELDLLGDEDVESFTGSHTDLESAADNLFTSPPRPQPQPFQSLSIKTPAKSVPPTPGTALQQKIESKFEKSLGYTFNIHLQQQMVFFPGIHVRHFSISETNFRLLKRHLTNQKWRWIRPPLRPGPSNQAVNLDPPHPRPRPTSHSVEAMEFDYGPALPPRLGADQPHHDNASDLMNLLGPKSILTLTKSTTLNQGLPRMSIQVNLMNLGCII